MTTANGLALYARVSTASQDSGMQMDALREYASRRRLPAVEYVDEGVSGAKDSRPELDRMMGDARRRKFGALVVWRFDRAARSVEHLARLLKEMDALGIAFISLTESVDTSTAAGRMLFHVLAAVAEFERDLIRERVKAGMDHARAQGHPVGRPRLTLDDEELLRLHSAGLSIREISRTVTGSDKKGLRHPSPSLVSRELRRLTAQLSERGHPAMVPARTADSPSGAIPTGTVPAQACVRTVASTGTPS